MDWVNWLGLGALLVASLIGIVAVDSPTPGAPPTPTKTAASQPLSLSSSSVTSAAQRVDDDPEAAIDAQITELDRQDQLLHEKEELLRTEAEAEARRQEQEAAKRDKQERLAQEAAIRAKLERHDREQSQGWRAFLKALIKKDKAAAYRIVQTLDQTYSTDQLLSASDLTSAIATKVGKFARLTVKFDSDAPGGVLVFPYSVDLGFRLLGEDIRPNLPQRLFLDGAPHNRFVSDEVFTVVGRIKGTYKYDTAFGGTNTVPAIRFEYLFSQ